MKTSKINISGAEQELEFPVLKSGEIHLWRVSLTPDKGLLKQCELALSSRELGRMEFFDFEKVKSEPCSIAFILANVINFYHGTINSYISCTLVCIAASIFHSESDSVDT